jgi:hypothetical protein
MPSRAYRHWNCTRSAELDEVEAAHTLLGSSGHGRRYTTQQINRAYYPGKIVYPTSLKR